MQCLSFSIVSLLSSMLKGQSLSHLGNSGIINNFELSSGNYNSMFTISRAGYHVIIYYKDQLWLDHEQPDTACEDFKFCYIIKGETLDETAPFYVKRFYGPEGEYQVYLTVNIVDDLENQLTLQFNITLNVKNNRNKKNKLFPYLGGL